MTTKDKVKELRAENRRIKGAKIARLLGISRERVRQILVELGEPTAIYKGRGCCKVCGKLLWWDNITGLCWEHFNLKKRAQSTLLLSCPGCKKLFLLRKSIVKARLKRNKMIFCSHSCQGVGVS